MFPNEKIYDATIAKLFKTGSSVILKMKALAKSVDSRMSESLVTKFLGTNMLMESILLIIGVTLVSGLIALIYFCKTNWWRIMP